MNKNYWFKTINNLSIESKANLDAFNEQLSLINNELKKDKSEENINALNELFLAYDESYIPYQKNKKITEAKYNKDQASKIKNSLELTVKEEVIKILAEIDLLKVDLKSLRISDKKISAIISKKIESLSESFETMFDGLVEPEEPEDSEYSESDYETDISEASEELAEEESGIEIDEEIDSEEVNEDGEEELIDEEENVEEDFEEDAEESEEEDLIEETEPEEDVEELNQFNNVNPFDVNNTEQDIIDNDNPTFELEESNDKFKLDETPINTFDYKDDIPEEPKDSYREVKETKPTYEEKEVVKERKTNYKKSSSTNPDAAKPKPTLIEQSKILRQRLIKDKVKDPTENEVSKVLKTLSKDEQEKLIKFISLKNFDTPEDKKDIEEVLKQREAEIYKNIEQRIEESMLNANQNNNIDSGAPNENLSSGSDPFSSMGQEAGDPFTSMGQNADDPFASMGGESNDPFSSIGQDAGDPFSSIGQDAGDPFSSMGKNTNDPFAGSDSSSNDPFANTISNNSFDTDSNKDESIEKNTEVVNELRKELDDLKKLIKKGNKKRFNKKEVIEVEVDKEETTEENNEWEIKSSPKPWDLDDEPADEPKQTKNKKIKSRFRKTKEGDK